jgi:hypothetical protein
MLSPPWTSLPHAARCETMEAVARDMVEQAGATKAERPRVAAGRSGGGERGGGGAGGCNGCRASAYYMDEQLAARALRMQRKLSLGLPPLAPAVKPDGRRLSVSWTQAARAVVLVGSAWI